MEIFISWGLSEAAFIILYFVGNSRHNGVLFVLHLIFYIKIGAFPLPLFSVFRAW